MNKLEINPLDIFPINGELAVLLLNTLGTVPASQGADAFVLLRAAIIAEKNKQQEANTPKEVTNISEETKSE